MALHRGIDDLGPDGHGAPTGRLVRRHLRREVAISGRLTTGTLACPSCDAPVGLPEGAVAPADAMGCGYCGHEGHVRDFLSLGQPPRPTRVEVRLVAPERVVTPRPLR